VSIPCEFVCDESRRCRVVQFINMDALVGAELRDNCRFLRYGEDANRSLIGTCGLRLLALGKGVSPVPVARNAEGYATMGEHCEVHARAKEQSREFMGIQE